MSSRVRKYLRLSNVLHNCQKIVPCSLHTARWDPVLRVILSVVQVPILHVRNVQPGNVAVVPEDAKVRVCRDEVTLEQLLANHIYDRMRRRISICIHQPRVPGPCLEYQLPAPAAARLQVDESPDI